MQLSSLLLAGAGALVGFGVSGWLHSLPDDSKSTEAIVGSVTDGKKEARLQSELGEWQEKYRRLMSDYTLLSRRQSTATETKVVDKAEAPRPDAKPEGVSPELASAGDPASLIRFIKYMPHRSYRPYRDYRAYKDGDGKQDGSEADYRRRPFDRVCVATKAYCLVDTDSSECFGTEEFCRKFPTSPYCIGTQTYCQSRVKDEACIGTYQWCANNPSHAACNGSVQFCTEFPNRDGCVGTEISCARAAHPTLCRGDDF